MVIKTLCTVRNSTIPNLGHATLVNLFYCLGFVNIDFDDQAQTYNKDSLAYLLWRLKIALLSFKMYHVILRFFQGVLEQSYFHLKCIKSFLDSFRVFKNSLTSFRMYYNSLTFFRVYYNSVTFLWILLDILRSLKYSYICLICLQVILTSFMLTLKNIFINFEFFGARSVAFLVITAALMKRRV